MNIKNLELKKYKYKELCDVLEIECKKSTNSKKAQLKELKRYCNIQKEKTLYNVLEIYTEVKEKIDDRKGHSGKSEGSRRHNDKFAKYVDVLMEQFLFEHKNSDNHMEGYDSKHIHITNNFLAQRIGMVNYNYRTCYNYREEFHKFIREQYKSALVCAERDVFYYAYSKIKSCLLGSLNRLQAEEKITFKLTYLILKENKVMTMDEEDIDCVKRIETKLLDEMNVTKAEVINKHKIKTEFYEKFNKMVKDYFKQNENDIDGFGLNPSFWTKPNKFFNFLRFKPLSQY
ncbi:hypothetical protein [Clostridium felsineum]|uniref:hypothetical protein n=1 Tax=Clostridium felsineum TaxID=36839 RepID=UPI00098C9F69|nr:hypothetical protein [Clostridium felsineum]URZ00588.1 hypothetical protein CLAUR_005760 [Clostridium felsineum]